MNGKEALATSYDDYTEVKQAKAVELDNWNITKFMRKFTMRGRDLLLQLGVSQKNIEKESKLLKLVL